MQAERDMLHTLVIPELEAFAREYQQSLSFIDLRWGVNTEELDSVSGAHKVLSVCLNEIDYCKPYMLVFIGERYGWVPDEDNLRAAAQAKDYILDEYEKSVTALEIEYGALNRMGTEKQCLFYFRNPLPRAQMNHENQAIYCAENESSTRKLNALKRKIEIKFPDRVRTYEPLWDDGVTGLDKLAAQVSSDLKRLLLDEWGSPTERDWRQKALDEARLIMDESNRRFSGRAALLATYRNQISAPETRLYFLTGNCGTGKTAFLSQLAQSFESEHFNVIYTNCGNNKSETIEEIMAQIIFALELLIDGEHCPYERDFVALRTKLIDLVAMYENQITIPLYLFIDGLEKVDHTQEVAKLIFLPDVIPDHVTFVISCSKPYRWDTGVGGEIEKLFTLPNILPFGRHTLMQEVGILSQQDAIDLVKGILKANHKELSDVIVTAIASPNEEILETIHDIYGNPKDGKVSFEEINNHIDSFAMREPLYYALLVQRLLMMDSTDFAEIDRLGGNIKAIHQFMMGVVGDDRSIDALIPLVIKKASQKINPSLYQLVFPMLACSRNGLRERDLVALTARYEVPPFSTLDFSRFIQYLGPFFTKNDSGRVDISTYALRASVEKELANTHNYKDQLFNYIIDELPYDDEIYQANYLKLAKDLKQNLGLPYYVYSLLNSDGDANIRTLADQVIRALRETCSTSSWLSECFQTLQNTDENHVYLISVLLETLYRWDLLPTFTLWYEFDELPAYENACTLIESRLSKTNDAQEIRTLTRVRGYYKMLHANFEFRRLHYETALHLYTDAIDYFVQYDHEYPSEYEDPNEHYSVNRVRSLTQCMCKFAECAHHLYDREREHEAINLAYEKIYAMLSNAKKMDFKYMVAEIFQIMATHQLGADTKEEQIKAIPFMTDVIDYIDALLDEEYYPETISMMIHAYILANEAERVALGELSGENIQKAEEWMSEFLLAYPGEDTSLLYCELYREKAKWLVAKNDPEAALELAMSQLDILEKRNEKLNNIESKWHLSDGQIFTAHISKHNQLFESALDYYEKAWTLSKWLFFANVHYMAGTKMISCSEEITTLLSLKNETEKINNLYLENKEVFSERLTSLLERNIDASQNEIMIIRQFLDIVNKKLNESQPNKLNNRKTLKHLFSRKKN
jgi:hypothetical protein